MVAPPVLAAVAVVFSLVAPTYCNTTKSWLDKRGEFIHWVYGNGNGVLPTKSTPDNYLFNVSEGVDALVWNMTTRFEITSTVFYSRVNYERTSDEVFLFHHGHTNCICPVKQGDPPVERFKCKPGCNSTMPTGNETLDPGYTWWDLYNVSNYFNQLGMDVFILSMPLKGVNLGPGSNSTYVNTNHWWFLQWEQQGDFPLRYFVEPCYLTVNYALQKGYKKVHMAGLSGGGWSTTFASAIDKRIQYSFPIAGSIPCAMRNPNKKSWPWGNDSEDYEQNCSPNPNPPPYANVPGRPAFHVCNYTCQYLLAGLEPGRAQLQILHEYDSCCFAPHNRHDQMLRYERNVRAELSISGQGWFTCSADNHTKHEVCPQDKHLITEAMKGKFPPRSPQWNTLPCDIIHNPHGKCPWPHPPLLPAEATGTMDGSVGDDNWEL